MGSSIKYKSKKVEYPDMRRSKFTYTPETLSNQSILKNINIDPTLAEENEN